MKKRKASRGPYRIGGHHPRESKRAWYRSSDGSWVRRGGDDLIIKEIGRRKYTAMRRHRHSASYRVVGDDYATLEDAKRALRRRKVTSRRRNPVRRENGILGLIGWGFAAFGAYLAWQWWQNQQTSNAATATQGALTSSTSGSTSTPALNAATAASPLQPATAATADQNDAGGGGSSF